jgi:hypothetical protein
MRRGAALRPFVVYRAVPNPAAPETEEERWT